MTQKDKELLLKDLCARLPYGVLCQIKGDNINTPRKLSRIEVDELDGILLDFWTDREDYLSIQVYLSEVKPYLRPMSNMTEDEKENLQSLHDIISDENYGDGYSPFAWDAITKWEDYCNLRHLDYRGLIPKRLALEAPKGMYEY